MEYFLGLLPLSSCVLGSCYFYGEDCVVEEVESDELVMGYCLVSWKHEVFNSLPGSDEAVVTAHVRFQDWDVVARGIGEMKIVHALRLFILILSVSHNEVYFFYLSKTDDSFEDNLIEEEGVNLEGIHYSFFVFVEIYVALDFYWGVWILCFWFYISPAPVCYSVIAWNIWTLRVEGAQTPGLDRAQFDEKIYAFDLGFGDRMEIDSDLTSHGGLHNDRLFAVFFNFKSLFHNLIDDSFDIDFNLTLFQSWRDGKFESVQTSKF